MIYLGYFLLCFAFIRLLVALVNLVTSVYLPLKFYSTNNPKVSILIPARNEEENIGLLLSDISNLSYHNYEVIVYDDSSTDNTANIVLDYAKSDTRISLIKGEILPHGWLGKNFACHNLALNAKGDFFLFLDADVRIGKSLLERAVYFADKKQLKLLSIFPKQILDNRGTIQIVPIMNWILLSLLPLILIRVSNRTSFSAANGQFMFFEAEMYKKLLPHQQVKNSKVEDIEICRYYKKQNMYVATLLGDDDIRCRMYKTRKEAIKGFSKNVFAFFGNSVFLTLLFAILTTLSPILLYFIIGLKAAVIYFAAAILIKVCTSAASKQSIVKNILYMPLQQYNFLIIIYNALIYRKNKYLDWKGRNVIG